ncbi:MAG: DUF507 family protein [Deltaproteobacteria bacterium]|nr:DUF507 family protein [Deltaproteobacteria bacterium]
MNLRKEQIPHLSQIILSQVKKLELAQFKVPEEKILHTIQSVIEKNYQAEAKLNEEVEQVMAQYSTQIEQGGLNASELFLKIKKELAKKKGFVL